MNSRAINRILLAAGLILALIQLPEYIWTNDKVTLEINQLDRKFERINSQLQICDQFINDPILLTWEDSIDIIDYYEIRNPNNAYEEKLCRNAFQEALLKKRGTMEFIHYRHPRFIQDRITNDVFFGDDGCLTNRCAKRIVKMNGEVIDFPCFAAMQITLPKHTKIDVEWHEYN